MANRNRKKHNEELDRMLEDLVILGEKIKGLEQEVERLKGENTNLLTANQDLVGRLQDKVNELEQTTTTLEKVLKDLKAIKQLPNYYAHFLDFVDRENSVADILSGGQRKRVGVNPDIDVRALLLGVSVIVSGETSAVIGIDPNPES